MALPFIDGLTNVFNQLVNRRNAQNQNAVNSQRVPDEQLRQIYKSGIGSRIVNVKSDHALNGTIQFKTKQDNEFYTNRLEKEVKRASKFMLSDGRGIIVLFHPGDDISKPLKLNGIDENTIRVKAFSGDIVTVADTDMSLLSDRYLKPKVYNVRGENFHHSRVIDFTYVEPPEFEAANYRYGGISEFERIYEQIINDGVVERATTTILEKSSSFVYKVKGFKENLRNKQDKHVVDYFSKIADMRGIYGDVLIDSEDEAMSVTQQLSNLAEANENSLRRLSMVSGLSLPWLVGENVKGMNSVGENERQIFQNTIENFQSGYLLDPINQLVKKFGRGSIEFKENQGETPASRMAFETKAIENSFKLWQMGEDSNKYLTQNNVIEQDNWEDYWAEDDEEVSDEEIMRRSQASQGVSNGEA